MIVNGGRSGGKERLASGIGLAGTSGLGMWVGGLRGCTLYPSPSDCELQHNSKTSGPSPK